MAKTLVFDVEYPHPPEKVWAALTSSESLAQWLMRNDFAPRVGHKFQFRAKPQPGWDGIVHCEVLELDAPRRMKWKWASSALDTTVAFTLEPIASGTRLRLVHDGFKGVKGHLISWMMGGGWKRMVREYLPTLLDGGTPARADCADAPAAKAS